jgi:hypothetical protein
MSPHDREWLLDHLGDQVRHLAVATDHARQHPGDPEQLLRVRDEVFTIRETLDTLGVPHALAANAEWSRANRT